MLKRFIFYSLLFSLFIGSIYFVYRIYKPKEIDAVVNTIEYHIDNEISFEQLDEILIERSNVCVVFYKTNDVGSKYLFDTILSSIQSAYSLKTFENLYYIDVTSLDEQQETMINKYKVEKFPSLIKYELKKGEATITSKIENSTETSITYENVENWLNTCELIIKQ